MNQTTTGAVRPWRLEIEMSDSIKTLLTEGYRKMGMSKGGKKKSKGNK